MTSGRVQVATTGIQDVFLTGSPDITYFQKKFQRHTKFALELLDNPFTEAADFGKTVRATIDRKGDLIRNVFLRVKLSDLDTAGASNVGYTDSIGHAMIDYADLIIGGQTVQRITGEYMEIYTDMFISDSQQLAITALVGKTGTVDGLGPASSSEPGPYGKYPRTFFVLLPFYYNRADPLAIPLSALTRQEVEVSIKFKPLDQLIVSPTASPLPTTTGRIVSASLPVEYVFLGEDEVSQIRNSRLDYVITQLQMAQTTIQPGVNSPRFRLDFTNPVKELYVVIQNQSNVQANDWFNFTNPENLDNLQNHQLLSIQLDFNGETYLDSEVADTSFMYAIQPMNRHTRVPDRLFYTYSFALDPENYLPTGQVNMSRIQNKLITLNLSDCTDTRKIRIYAKSYNVLRIENGLAGVLFIDNNFI